MLREEAIELLFDIQTDAVYNVLSDEKEALEMAINVLKQQPYDNAISRESVIEWLKDKDIIKTKNQEENAKRELAELPSVQSTRPTARWERLVEDYNKCSKCGEMGKLYRIYKYCPNCGAKIQEVEE